MQFDFKEKAKKRQDRNSPIKPLFCIQFENPSKVSWGEFQISMGFVQPPRSAPIFDSPHESLVTHSNQNAQGSRSPRLPCALSPGSLFPCAEISRDFVPCAKSARRPQNFVIETAGLRSCHLKHIVSKNKKYRKIL